MGIIKKKKKKKSPEITSVSKDTEKLCIVGGNFK
jgi:putative N-acetylmannosamine-6-phosphate epimerase